VSAAEGRVGGLSLLTLSAASSQRTKWPTGPSHPVRLERHRGVSGRPSLLTLSAASVTEERLTGRPFLTCPPRATQARGAGWVFLSWDRGFRVLADPFDVLLLLGPETRSSRQAVFEDYLGGVVLAMPAENLRVRDESLQFGVAGAGDEWYGG